MSEPIRKEASGRYVAVVDVARSGEKRRQLKRRFDTRKEARSWLAEVRSNQNRGTFVAPDRTTLKQFVEQRWLPAVRTELRASTWSSYERNLRLHVFPVLGDVQLQALDPGRIQ